MGEGVSQGISPVSRASAVLPSWFDAMGSHVVGLGAPVARGMTTRAWMRQVYRILIFTNKSGSLSPYSGSDAVDEVQRETQPGTSRPNLVIFSVS